MSSEEPKTFEWCSEDDGYGIVGWSFVCPHCSKNNRFVSDDFEEHECEHCRMISMPEAECPEC